jgi:hypothetical protein
VGLQVEVGAVGDAFEFVPTPGEEELDIGRPRRVVGELIGIVVTEAELLGRDPEIEIPAEALVEPVVEPGLGQFWGVI